MAENFLGNIRLDRDDLVLPTPELVYLMLHEANHSKQLVRNFWDKRYYSKTGRMVVELEATLQAINDMMMGYCEKDFLEWELNLWLIKKYGIDLTEFKRLINKLSKTSKGGINNGKVTRG